MATFIAIKNKKQTAGAMQGVLKYVAQDYKTKWGDSKFVTGHNCVPQCAFTEMMTTKKRFRKTDGRQFYHFVQSFPEEDGLTPQEVNAIGLEFAAREFPDFEVVVATHLDTGHLHNHLVVNSVNCVDGKKLHQNAADLQVHRNMEQEGYEVVWSDNRNHITFITPEGRRCRNSSLNDETFIKDNLEMLFIFRQAFGFSPGSVEEIGPWAEVQRRRLWIRLQYVGITQFKI